VAATVLSDADLYARGVRTLLACWESYADGSAGASVERRPGVAAAVFPRQPERGVYNNALLEHDLSAGRRAAAIEAMESAYAAADVARFAAWVHESDGPMRLDLEQRGYRLEESTRAMGMALDQIQVPRPELELGRLDWTGYLRTFGLPPGLLGGADHARYHLLIARLDGQDAATALAFDCEGDCGIYNVGTLAPARRRGLGTALTALQLHEARARGCRTASLQSTEMAERIYAAVGFRDLGRILEYVPSG
jgi:GNAT superfamily N-acetyltransferase